MLGAATGELTVSYGSYLLQMVLALVAVSALAVLALRFLRRRGVGLGRGLRVVARLDLEPRRSLYVVEVAGKLLLLGVGDGPMALIAELDPTKVGELETRGAAEGGLVDLIKRVLGRRGAGS
jgi:flagellar biosynthetic protein FliO